MCERFDDPMLCEEMVAVPRGRYDELLRAETRLNILRDDIRQRIDDDEPDYALISTDETLLLLGLRRYREEVRDISREAEERAARRAAQSDVQNAAEDAGH